MTQSTRTSFRSALLRTASGVGLAAVIAAVAAPGARAEMPGWMGDVKLGVQVQAGMLINTDTAGSGVQFGHLFTDRANVPTLNQSLFTLSKTVDPKAEGFDWGFKLQGMVGSDARFTRFMGFGNTAQTSRVQLDLMEANLSFHLPVVTEGGVDLKVGLYPTPIGYETIDPSTNPFYTHSYIFNFGIPLKHAGAYAIVHATDLIDVYAGADTGMQTTFGKGDNNRAAAGLFGLQFNFADADLTILALSHFGAENARVVDPSQKLRYENDAVITYKKGSYTFVTELNWIHDDFGKANAYGIAQYVSYTVNDSLALNLRAEFFHDDKGFFVAAFPGNNDFVQAELGRPNGSFGVGKASYGSLTVGASYKPPGLGDFNVLVRPELRYDRELSGKKAYNGGRDKGALTLAADVIFGF